MLPKLESREGYGVLFYTEKEWRELQAKRNSDYREYIRACGFKPYEPPSQRITLTSKRAHSSPE